MTQDISKMETTAVEWLVKELKLEGYDYTISQAKALEKEHMHKCASFWRGKENDIEKPIFDIYYKETYEL